MEVKYPKLFDGPSGPGEADVRALERTHAPYLTTIGADFLSRKNGPFRSVEVIKAGIDQFIAMGLEALTGGLLAVSTGGKFTDKGDVAHEVFHGSPIGDFDGPAPFVNGAATVEFYPRAFYVGDGIAIAPSFDVTLDELTYASEGFAIYSTKTGLTWTHQLQFDNDFDTLGSWSVQLVHGAIWHDAPDRFHTFGFTRYLQPEIVLSLPVNVGHPQYVHRDNGVWVFSPVPESTLPYIAGRPAVFRVGPKILICVTPVPGNGTGVAFPGTPIQLSIFSMSIDNGLTWSIINATPFTAPLLATLEALAPGYIANSSLPAHFLRSKSACVPETPTTCIFICAFPMDANFDLRLGHYGMRIDLTTGIVDPLPALPPELLPPALDTTLAGQYQLKGGSQVRIGKKMGFAFNARRVDQPGAFATTEDGITWIFNVMPLPSFRTGKISVIDSKTLACPMFNAPAHDLYVSKDFGATWTKRAEISQLGIDEATGFPADPRDSIFPANYYAETASFDTVTLLQQAGQPAPTFPGARWIGDDRVPFVA